MAGTRKPNFGKPRAASGAFSLSRKLPKLNLPPSSATKSGKRGSPKVAAPKSSPNKPR